MVVVVMVVEVVMVVVVIVVVVMVDVKFKSISAKWGLFQGCHVAVKFCCS